MSRRLSLESFLQPDYAGALPQLTCLFSDEPLFQSLFTDLFRKRLRTTTEYQRYCIEQDKSFDSQQFLGLLSEGSLFGDVSLIELRLTQPKLSKELAHTLEQACQWVSENRTDHTLLVTGPHLNKRQMSADGLKTLLGHATEIVCPLISIESMPSWIIQTAKRHQLTVQHGAARWLAEQTEGNLLAAHQCIQKLVLECPDGQVNLNAVAQVATNASRFNVFDLGKTMLSGNKARIVKMLQGLQAEGQAPTLVLWCLLEEVRAIRNVRNALSRGDSLHQACRTHRVWGDREKQINHALKHHSTETLQKLLGLCYFCEKTIKGLEPGSPWVLFETIGLGIAGQPVPHLPPI